MQTPKEKLESHPLIASFNLQLHTSNDTLEAFQAYVYEDEDEIFKDYIYLDGRIQRQHTSG